MKFCWSWNILQRHFSSNKDFLKTFCGFGERQKKILSHSCLVRCGKPRLRSLLCLVQSRVLNLRWPWVKQNRDLSLGPPHSWPISQTYQHLFSKRHSFENRHFTTTPFSRKCSKGFVSIPTWSKIKFWNLIKVAMKLNCCPTDSCSSLNNFH